MGVPRLSRHHWLGQATDFRNPTAWVILPTALRRHGLRVVIRTNDHPPPHVHVRAGSGMVKIMIAENRFTDRRRMDQATLRMAMRTVRDNRAFLLQAWKRIHGEGN